MKNEDRLIEIQRELAQRSFAMERYFETHFFEPRIKQARREALEDAAKVCDALAAKFAADGDGLDSDPRWALAIRALIEPACSEGSPAGTPDSPRS